MTLLLIRFRDGVVRTCGLASAVGCIAGGIAAFEVVVVGCIACTGFGASPFDERIVVCYFLIIPLLFEECSTQFGTKCSSS